MNAKKAPVAKHDYIREDEGFFGPESVAWKVWTFPASAFQGFVRAVTIEHLDPDLATAIEHSCQVVQRTPIRYDRTMEYFAAVLFADSKTVIKMADVLMKVHGRSYGPNPVTGKDYDSNASESQKWIHITAWHSIIYVYETFGPGKLSRDEENQYWAECKTAAKFQPIDLTDFPETRGQAQEYLDSWREKLGASEAAVFNIDHILDAFTTAFHGLPRPLQVIGRPFFRWSVIATYPRWMRKMAGVKQGPVKDAFAIALWRVILRSVYKFPALEMWFIDAVNPRGAKYVEQGVRKIPAKTPRVYTPEVARKMHGDPRSPLEQAKDMAAARQQGTGLNRYGHNHKDDIIEFESARSADGSEITTPQKAS
ncbi:oxygenase MpaB family protein [Corynebacterium sputi]|uniref:oxygenase MpaB family protein n=1 Tax=Corynebacterium sputi TaxID=489915 RepID=UPI001F0B2886|nr:oxygenase MpaB family protein [Corynebacterium sputi]